MSPKEKWWRKYIAPSIVMAIVTIGIFWYTTFYNIPKLSYEVLESYPLSDNEHITLIIFRNTGRSPANNIVINIESTGLIQNYICSSPEEIEVNKTTPKKLRVKMLRLVQGVRVSIYIQTLMQLSTPFSCITMTSDQGKGNVYVSLKSPFPGIIEVFVLILALIIIIITFGILTRNYTPYVVEIPEDMNS